MGNQLSALDPANESDTEIIRSLLRRRRQSFDAELRELARRVHDQASDRLLRVDALNLLGSAAVVEGDDDEGSRHFRQALDATWGTGSHAERVACINLAMILTRQRRLLEALALNRRACRIALEAGDALGTCLAHVQLGKTLLELGDQDGFARAVETAERHRPEMDETLDRWIPHLLAGMHAEVALQHGDFARAQGFLDEALDGPDADREVVDMMRATSLRRMGRASEALAVVRAALADGAEAACWRLRFRAEELLCLVAIGDRATLAARASECLAEMAREGRACGSPTWRMRVGQAVGAALLQDEGTRGQARRAFEIAAAAALERSWESKRFFEEFPQLERMEPEDRALLEAHAERFRGQHLELLEAMRGLLCDGPGAEAALGAPAGELFVTVCAWCRSVRGPERAWIPLDEFVPSRDIDVTHGICPACIAAMPGRGGAPARRADAEPVARH